MIENSRNDTEGNRRLAFSLLLAAVRFARRCRIPLMELTELVQLAYFHDAQQSGLKMREMTEVLGVSMRKLAKLSQQLKRRFTAPDSEHGVPRRIEFLLWAGPATIASIHRAFPELDAEPIDAAVERLLAQGRIEVQEGRTPRYAVVKSQFRLVEDALLGRVDGLNNLMGSLSNTVWGRFVREDARAFARTLSLRVPRGAAKRLEGFYERVFWPFFAELDEQASHAKEAETFDVSLFWAPQDSIEGPKEED